MAGGVFHRILYHLVSSCQEIFCPVLGIEGDRAEPSAKFDDSVARFETRLKSWPELLERGNERGSSAIAEADPNKLDFGFRPTGKVQKIFVLADNHASLGFGVTADLRIRRLGKADVENVLAIETTCSEMLGKREGKLVINKKIHEDWRTA